MDEVVIEIGDALIHAAPSWCLSTDRPVPTRRRRGVVANAFVCLVNLRGEEHEF
jgi:hypothetical protein